MALRTFSLSPFPGEFVPPGLAVSVAVGRRAGVLHVRHEIAGDLSGLAIPPPAPRPERRDHLWQECCMELFLGERGSERYLEFNLSPAGHWNVYRFDSYRHGMREAEEIADLPFRVDREAGALALSLEVDIGKLFPAGNRLSAGGAAVVRTAAGGTSHWALAHTGPRPDFHRRDAFLIDLAGGPAYDGFG
jgi:hypothetical protein